MSQLHIFITCVRVCGTQKEREGREGGERCCTRLCMGTQSLGEREGEKALMIHVLFKALQLVNIVICFIVYNIHTKKIKTLIDNTQKQTPSTHAIPRGYIKGYNCT